MHFTVISFILNIKKKKKKTATVFDQNAIHQHNFLLCVYIQFQDKKRNIRVFVGKNK